MMKPTKNILQEKFEGFEPSPPRDLWAEIEANIQPERKRRVGWFYYIGAAAASVMIAGVVSLYLSRPAPSSTVELANHTPRVSQSPLVAETPRDTQRIVEMPAVPTEKELVIAAPSQKTPTENAPLLTPSQKQQAPQTTAPAPQLIAAAETQAPTESMTVEQKCSMPTTPIVKVETESPVLAEAVVPEAPSLPELVVEAPAVVAAEPLLAQTESRPLQKVGEALLVATKGISKFSDTVAVEEEESQEAGRPAKSLNIRLGALRISHKRYRNKSNTK